MAFSRQVVVLLFLLMSLSIVQANSLLAVRTSILTASSALLHRFFLVFKRIPQVFGSTPLEWTAPSNEPSMQEAWPTPDILGDQILALYNVMKARIEEDQVPKSRYESALLAIKSRLPYLWRSSKSTGSVAEDLLSGLAAKLNGAQTTSKGSWADEQKTAEKVQSIKEKAQDAVGVGSGGVPESDSGKTLGLGMLGAIARNAKKGLLGARTSTHSELVGDVKNAGGSVAQEAETDRYTRIVVDWASDRRVELNSKEVREYVGSLWKEAKEFGYEGLGLKRKAEEHHGNARYRNSLSEAGKQIRKRLETVSALVRNTVWDSWDEDTHNVVREAMQALTKLDREVLEKRDEIVQEITAISEPYTNELRKGATVIMKELRATQNPLVKQWANEVIRVLSNSLSPEVKQMFSKHFGMMRSAFQSETDAAQVLLNGVIDSELFQSFTKTKLAILTCGQDTFCIAHEWLDQVLSVRLFVGLALCIVLYFIDVFFDVSHRVAVWMEAKFKEHLVSKFQRRARNVNFGDTVSVEEIGPDYDRSDLHQDRLSVDERLVPMDIRKESQQRSRQVRTANQGNTHWLGRAEELRTATNAETARQGPNNNGAGAGNIPSGTRGVAETQLSGSKVSEVARSPRGTGPSTENTARRTTPRRIARKPNRFGDA